MQTAIRYLGSEKLFSRISFTPLSWNNLAIFNLRPVSNLSEIEVSRFYSVAFFRFQLWFVINQELKLEDRNSETWIQVLAAAWTTLPIYGLN